MNSQYDVIVMNDALPDLDGMPPPEPGDDDDDEGDDEVD